MIQASQSPVPHALMNLTRLEEPAPRWRNWLRHAITIALIAALAFSVSVDDVRTFLAAVEARPVYLLAVVALYFALPIADWIIFRRLWRLPVAGFPVLLRKRISNELLLDYSGELYFYLWARQRANLTAAPFGAIKDVNIQSALAANLVTLLLLVVAYPFVTQLHMGDYAQAATWSAVLIIVLSFGLLLFRKRVFSLDRATLAWIFGVHIGRLAVTTTLAAVAWHLLVPTAPIGLWLALSALRLVVTRLPLIPQKEILFASIALFLLGQDAATSGLVALTSASLMGMHLVVGLGLVIAAFVPVKKPAVLEPTGPVDGEVR